MSIAAAQYSKFMTQVAADGKVFTFTQEGDFLVYPMKKAEVIPFWSSRQRLLKIQAVLPKYQKFQIEELSIESFLEQLPNLEKEKVRIGVNWSGKNLTGYDVSIEAVKAALDYVLKK